MSDSTNRELEDLSESWSRAVTSMVWGHWLMLDAGFRATQTMLATAVPVAGNIPVGEPAALAALALERVKRGLAPPREVYLAPLRNRINWADFPDWARPSDPELYEGCAHEG
jgi:hypothetical protein